MIIEKPANKLLNQKELIDFALNLIDLNHAKSLINSYTKKIMYFQAVRLSKL